MQFTNEKRFFEKKKISHKKSIKYFYYFYRFFSCENNIFFNGKFLTKLERRPELNKFET